jgi:hypothetical protein
LYRWQAYGLITYPKVPKISAKSCIYGFMMHLSSCLLKVWGLGKDMFLPINGSSSSILARAAVPPLNSFCSFVKSQSGIFVWVYFWIPILFHRSGCLAVAQYHTALIIETE